MKRQKPNFIKDWADDLTRWGKWYARKMERVMWKRKIRKEQDEV